MKQQVGACLASWMFLVSAALPQLPSGASAAEVEQGLAAMKSGKFAEAQRHFSAALKLDPSQVEVRADLGLAYYASHQYEQAIAEFNQALRLNSSLAIAKAFLPLSQAARGDCAEATAGLEREFASHPDPKLRRTLGLSLERCADLAGNEREAVEVSQKLLAAYPDDPDVLYSAGQLYGKLSSEIYLKLMKVAPYSARSYQVMGAGVAADGNWKAALDAYRHAIQLDPSLAGVHLEIAILLLIHSTEPDAWQQGLRELQQELQVDPTSAQAEYEIGEVYRKHGRLEEAVAAFRHALEFDSSAPAVRVGMAKALLQLGRKTEALSILEPAAKTHPEDPAVHFLLAQVYRELGRTAEAAQEEAEFNKLKRPE